jgi:MSHA biogenesis protein MshL
LSVSLRILRLTGALLLPLLFGACTPTTLSNGPSAGHLQADSVAKPQGAIPQPVQQSVYLPKPRAIGKTETYSVVVNNVQVHDLLFALARDARLNVDVHPGLTGLVTLNAIDQTLPQLLSRIAKQVDMRFELDGPNLAVMPDAPYLKNYKVDYVNIARDVTATVSTNTQISTSSLATGSGGVAGSGNTSRIQIENKSRNRFWESLEKNLKDLLHETDKVFPEGSTETVTEQTASQSTTGTGAASPAQRRGTCGAGRADAGRQSESGDAAEQRRHGSQAHDLPGSGIGNCQSGRRGDHRSGDLATAREGAGVPRSGDEQRSPAGADRSHDRRGDAF